LVLALAAAYLGVQLLLPLFVAARPGFAPRDFSWDMFSHRLSCAQLELRARVNGGDWFAVPLHEDFGSWGQLARVLVPERLTPYTRHVCAKLRTAHAGRVELHVLTRCREDVSGWTQLTDPQRDYCAVAR
jgi:hypothetical protein